MMGCTIGRMECGENLTLKEYIELGGSTDVLVTELDRFFLDNNKEETDKVLRLLCSSQQETYDILDMLDANSCIGLGFCLDQFRGRDNWTEIFCSGRIHFGRESGCDSVWLSEILEECLGRCIDPPLKDSHDIDVELPDFSELMELFS